MMTEETKQATATESPVDLGESRQTVLSGAGEPLIAAPPIRRARTIGGAMTQRRRGADYYDTILWRVLPKDAAACRGFTLGVTSCERRAGVSTVAANIAIRAADHRVAPTLVVDANLSHPHLERSFRLYDAPGLAELLAEECSLGEAIHDCGIEGLSVMPLGGRGLIDRTRVDHELLASLMTELRDEYGVIVFDLPEVSEMRHSLLFAQEVDAVLMVLRSEATRRKLAQRAASRLASDGVNLVGSVVTQQKSYIPRWFERWL